jgi:hypothetical protein
MGVCGYNPSYIDGGGFASLPQANAKGHDPSLIRCAFAEGKAPSYIDGGGVSTILARRMGSKGEGGSLASL